MKIIDIKEEYFETYACCFENWSEEMTNAGEHKRNWYNKLKEKGLKIKLALDENNVACGLIQYLPSEYSFIDAENIYFIPCIWVHGYKDKGVGNKQNKGIGTALLKAAEEDAKINGAIGIAAWGLSEPFWMPASWYKKNGYIIADKSGLMELVWKSFNENTKAPKWLKTRKNPEKIPGKVTVTAIISGWCTAYNVGFENFKKASKELGAEFIEVNTLNSEVIRKWGQTDAIFIDDELINLGPPPSYEETKKMIKSRIDKL